MNLAGATTTTTIQRRERIAHRDHHHIMSISMSMSPPQSLIWLRAPPADASEFVVFFRLSRARTFVRARSLVRPSPCPPTVFLQSAAQGVRACDAPENPFIIHLLFVSINLCLPNLAFILSYLTPIYLICFALFLPAAHLCAQQPSILFPSLPFPSLPSHPSPATLIAWAVL